MWECPKAFRPYCLVISQFITIDMVNQALPPQTWRLCQIINWLSWLFVSKIFFHSLNTKVYSVMQHNNALGNTIIWHIISWIWYNLQFLEDEIQWFKNIIDNDFEPDRSALFIEQMRVMRVVRVPSFHKYLPAPVAQFELFTRRYPPFSMWYPLRPYPWYWLIWSPAGVGRTTARAGRPDPRSSLDSLSLEYNRISLYVHASN